MGDSAGHHVSTERDTPYGDVGDDVAEIVDGWRELESEFRNRQRNLTDTIRFAFVIKRLENVGGRRGSGGNAGGGGLCGADGLF